MPSLPTLDDQQVIFRFIIEHLNNPGESADKRFDDCAFLTGLQDLVASRRLVLLAAAVNQALTFTAPAAIFIFSRNGQRFNLRMASGETLITNLKAFSLVSDDITRGVATTSLLLTGNGVNNSDLEIWIVEKVTS